MRSRSTCATAAPVPAAGPITLTVSLPAKLATAAGTYGDWTCTVERHRHLHLDGAHRVAHCRLAEPAVTASYDAPDVLLVTAAVTAPNDPQADSVTEHVFVDKAVNVVATQQAPAQILTGQAADLVLGVERRWHRDGRDRHGHDTLPTRLVPQSAAGTGWTCAINGRVVTCTRSDSIAPAPRHPTSPSGAGRDRAGRDAAQHGDRVAGGDQNADDDSTDATIDLVAPDVAGRIIEAGAVGGYLVGERPVSSA